VFSLGCVSAELQLGKRLLPATENASVICAFVEKLTGVKRSRMSPEIDSVFLEEKLTTYGYQDLPDIRVSFDVYKMKQKAMIKSHNTRRMQFVIPAFLISSASVCV